jgi:hypothetical protein
MRYNRQDYCGGLCILVALLTQPVYAMDVTLAWFPDTDPTIAGYNLYFGGASGFYTNRISTGNATNVTVIGLIPGATYYFAATANSTIGLESPLSSEVSYQVPANRPPTLNAIGNFSINQNAGLQTVNLSGITSGATDENQTLTIKAVSGNPGLIPNPTINYTSPNPTGRLTFQPAANQAGTAILTVTVNDGAASRNTVTRKFTVTVASTAGSRPVVVCPLTNQVALIGQTSRFAVKAAGRGALKYQWKFNGANLAIVSSTLTLKNVTPNQSGVYSVTVTDRNGSTNSTAALTVYASPAGKLASAGLADGQYTLSVESVPGYRYIVEASTDLADWVPVLTNTAPSAFVDTQAGRFSRRFYRSVYAP